MRVATLNLWMRNGDWPGRRRVLRDGFAALAADVIGFQEVETLDGRDSVSEILGTEYEIRHQRTGLLGDGNGAAIASRWPIAGWHETDLQLTPRTADFPATTLIAEIDAPSDAASIRFLRGLQSLGGVSAYYHDAWETAHPGDPGHTFTTRNPLMTEDSDVRVEVDRRIDYIFVRADERGPTLAVRRCDQLFAQPVDGVWASDHFGLVADLEPLGG
jgi:endonuclease/exonuclease/phosphatase family metal-dependent hydrolase